jgi:quercetin dioxygenase-like cupin family protein
MSSTEKNESARNAEPDVLELGHLIEYQDGSVVSRAIIKKKTGTVTLFAFDKGEALSEHTAPFDALVHIIDGTAEVTIDKQPYSLSAGEAIVLPANRPHSLRATDRFRMMLTMIRS